MRPRAPRGPLSARGTRSADGPTGQAQRISIFAGRARPGLLATFAVVSLIPLATLGFGLFYFLQDQIRSRALDGAGNSATLVARSSVEPLIEDANLRAPLPAALQEQLAASREQLHAAGVARIKLWNLDGKIVYSDKRELIGRTFPPAEDLREAAGGEVVSDVSDVDEAENIEDHGLG